MKYILIIALAIIGAGCQSRHLNTYTIEVRYQVTGNKDTFQVVSNVDPTSIYLDLGTSCVILSQWEPKTIACGVSSFRIISVTPIKH